MIETNNVLGKNFVVRSAPRAIRTVAVRKPRRLLRAFVTTLLIVLLSGGGWLGWNIYRSVAEATGNNNPLQLLSAFTPAELKTVNGRVNILLAGYSADDAGHSGAELTDSIMVLSIDQAAKTAAVISVPRDLYVNIPGHGYSKINAAYEYGEADNFSASGYAAGGMGLLEQTLHNALGIDFSYDALINYAAVKQAVDAVGGITMTIASGDSRGVYDPNTGINLPNGTVTLTGDQALALARSRGAGVGSYGFSNGDFDRAKYQQQMLLALKAKGGSASVIANPIKAGQLATSLGSNIQTDMALNVLQTIYQVSKTIPASSVTTYSLNSWNGQNLLSNYTTPSRQSALIPKAGVADFSAIQAAVDAALTSATGTSD